jgi:hypothetical protein
MQLAGLLHPSIGRLSRVARSCMLRLLRYTRRVCVDNMRANLANLSLEKHAATYSSSRGSRRMSGTELIELRMFSPSVLAKGTDAFLVNANGALASGARSPATRISWPVR